MVCIILAPRVPGLGLLLMILKMVCLKELKDFIFMFFLNLIHMLWKKCSEVVEAKFGKFFPQLKWINMGGGHLMTGKDYDTDHLIKILKQFHEKSGFMLYSNREALLHGKQENLLLQLKILLKIRALKQLFWMFHLPHICPIVLKCPINQKF